MALCSVTVGMLPCSAQTRERPGIKHHAMYSFKLDKAGLLHRLVEVLLSSAVFGALQCFSFVSGPSNSI